LTGGLCLPEQAVFVDENLALVKKNFFRGLSLPIALKKSSTGAKGVTKNARSFS
jgi:hypothetical protein